MTQTIEVEFLEWQAGPPPANLTQILIYDPTWGEVYPAKQYATPMGNVYWIGGGTMVAPSSILCWSKFPRGPVHAT